MNFSTNFFKVTSVCAIISGVLFVITWLLFFTFTLPMNLDDVIAVSDNPAYTWWLWIYCINVFFIITAFWGVAAKKMDTATGLVTTGFFFAFAYFIVVLLSFGIRLFPLSKAIAGWDHVDEVMKTDLLSSLFGLAGVLTLACIICILIAFVLYGIATWTGTGLEKLVSIFFFLCFICLALYTIGSFFSQVWLYLLMVWICYIVYAIAMFIVAGWLWKCEGSASI